MITIGLTGGVGSGKSAVGKMLHQLGIPVHDADKTVHEMYSDRKFVSIMSDNFPTTVINGKVDRKILGDLVYTEPMQRSILEHLVHEEVHHRQQKFIQYHMRNKTKIVVFDIPLLFETKSEQKFNYVMSVFCPSIIQEMRVMRRPGYTKERYLKIKSLQISVNERRKKSDIMIPTGLSKRDTRNALIKFLQSL